MSDLAAAFAPVGSPAPITITTTTTPAEIIPSLTPPPAEFIAGNSFKRMPDHQGHYLDAQGQHVLTVCRWDTPTGKEIRQLTPRAGGWAWKGHPDPRPLFGLPDLLANPDLPVLVVEGEKKMDAAKGLFPDYLVTTWPGGAQNVGKTDWLPLAGRDVLIWPDADKPGQDAAQTIRKARLGRRNPPARIIGLDALARQRAVVLARKGTPPEAAADLPPGWDAADALAEGWTPEDTAAALVEPPQDHHDNGMPTGYRLADDGLYWTSPDDEDATPVFICGRLDVLAQTCDESGNSWGRLLRWHDRQEREHRWAMPMKILAGDGVELRGALADGGLILGNSRSAREKLANYLQACNPTDHALCVTSAGWHDTREHGSVYVIRDQAGTVIPDSATGAIVYQGARSKSGVESAGDLDGWRDQVAGLCVGNSRLMFAVSCGFAGPLLRLAGMDGGGFHLRGGSSLGKTKCAAAAASVFGSEVHSWRATANGLEGTCTASNDGLLVLDELGQAEAQTAGETAYMIPNGRGKARMASGGALREPMTWRCLLLSTGEISLADLSREVGKSIRAGADLRIADIPADAGKGQGAFENIHDSPGDTPKAKGAAFANRIEKSTEVQRGSAGPAFLRALIADLDNAKALIRVIETRFADEVIPKDSDGQVIRVARRFALVAAAGELATGAGVTGWTEGAAFTAAATCFTAWLGARRGGSGAAEDQNAIDQVRGWIVANGSARFEPWESDDGRAVVNRAGWYRQRDGRREYCVPGSTWRSEVCKGLDPAQVARVLVAAGILIPAGDGKNSHSIRLPREGGTQRVYILTIGDAP